MVPQPLNVRFPCTPRHATRARQAFRVYLALLHLDARTESDLESAIGEALTNAVEHGFAQETFFELRCSLEDSMLQIEIEGRARAAMLPNRLERPLDARDMGLGIMRALVDDVELLEDGRLIRLQKKIRAANRHRAGKTAATPALKG
ncbi:MAG TPA: ATP-binding protein [Candidatus Baltobacteraceae bacterium]|jgi:anti-sigma regulatory factor (Ser/Thr protein kinase)